MQLKSLVTFCCCGLVIVAGTLFAASARPGYTDTPMILGQKWKVHDANRPHPPVVTPAKTFSDGAGAPSDATVLFDGTDLSKWTGGKWKVENGYMEIVKGGSLKTKDEFGDVQLHIEWAAPKMIRGESQGRGNSGVLFFGKYEVQVLDSFENPTYPDGQAGSLYGQYPPQVNAMRPPGEWQTYDIIFEAPKWEDGKNVKPAYVTVIHNGVVLHHRKEYTGASEHRNISNYKTPHSPKGSITLQDHGDPVRYRNIWIRNLRDYDVEAAK